MPRSSAALPSGRAAPLPPDERRAAIVLAALPLVARHGADVTTRQIAEAAGIAEGTVFRVFPDKDAIIAAVVAHVFTADPTVEQLDAIDPALSLRERIRQVADILGHRMSDVWQLMNALRLFTGPPQDDSAGDRTRRFLPRSLPDRTTELTKAIERIYSASPDEIRYTPADAARFTRLLIFSGTHPRIAENAPLTSEEVVALLFDGIRAP